MKIPTHAKLIIVTLSLLCRGDLTFSATQGDYPRIMAIAIGAPAKYDDPGVQKDLSKADVLILGFWPHWKENEQKSARDVIKAIKKINPDILIGQYTILNEAKASDDPDKTNKDIAVKLDMEKWWLKGPAGSRVRHTDKYGTWNINITKFTKPDRDNKRYPEWLAERNYRVFFQNAPEFDFWFMDITVAEPPTLIADWNNVGVPQLSIMPNISKMYREGQVAYWSAIRALQPDTFLIGNAIDLSSSEYAGQLNGAVFEAAMGLTWSTYERQGWEATRQKYYEFMRDTKAPKLVGFNVWGTANDYKKMRFGLTTCLLNDGYFSYTDEKKGYGEIPWFDEFDAKLGKPIEPPATMPLSNGAFRRNFSNGVSLVNPTNHSVTISLEKTYRKIRGNQDPSTNSGDSITTVTIPPKDGIILLSDEIAPSSPEKLKANPVSRETQQ